MGRRTKGGRRRGDLSIDLVRMVSLAPIYGWLVVFFVGIPYLTNGSWKMVFLLKKVGG